MSLRWRVVVEAAAIFFQRNAAIKCVGELIDVFAFVDVHGRPELLKLRKTLAEHPFGTIKGSMNQAGFLLKGLNKVSIEFGLTMLAYNFKRVLNHLGVTRMVQFIDNPELCTT